ncbi:hypothetical protein OPT61_g5982 [Boeremia exigua]|uniref:Uncharacterized protein n=1 Tax=Boeremia exigua TaxID=749465 RepID=A0ACC2I8L5_9PLEO|nr:hypothetical protein OPT61_g5982 [Boeremia exigua]
MLFNPTLSALLLLGSASAQVSTKSLVTCITKQGPKSSASVKTVSAVLTIPWYALRVTTSTPSRTTTPATSTTIVTTTLTSSTTTTLPVETDTITTTSTETSTVSARTTTTIVSDSTVYTTITNTETTTIAASAGFIPIESRISNSQKRHTEEDVSSPALERQQGQQLKLLVKNGRPAFEPVCYPQSVKCAGIVAVITTSIRTKTASTTRVVTAPTPIATATTTVTTSTIITEIPPRASSTVTAYTTITLTSTSTFTETSTNVVSATVSVAAPKATYYAACAENNVISTINGQGIDQAANRGGTFSYASDTPSAYDCCVIGLNTPNCAGTFWFSQGQGQCFVSIQNSGDILWPKYKQQYCAGIRHSSRNLVLVTLVKLSTREEYWLRVLLEASPGVAIEPTRGQDPFLLAPIDRTQQDIRLVELRRSGVREFLKSRLRQRPARIKCRLRSYSADKCPPYVALSYRWGSPIRHSDIELNGVLFPVASTVYTDLGLAVMLDICQNEYWSRMWIIQEVFVAKKAKIHIGSYTIDLEALHQNFEKRDLPSIPFAATPAATITFGRKESKDRIHSLGALLLEFKDSKASDVRDKVYALLGLTAQEPDIAVDYRTTPQELFEQVMVSVYPEPPRKFRAGRRFSAVFRHIGKDAGD